MARIATFLIAAAAVSAALAATAVPSAAAEPLLVQCGREYQAAKAAGTLNGADWNRYRTECSARLKAAPVAAAPTPAAPAVTAAPQAPTVAAVPVAAPASLPEAATPSAGLAAMRLRQKQCGADWRAQKATLIAQTPGLTWPRYWSQCNTRLKTTGH